MKLTGELKEKIEKAETKEQAKEILEKAGLELSEEELEAVCGGSPFFDGKVRVIPKSVI